MEDRSPRAIGELEFRYLIKNDKRYLQTRRVIACDGGYNGNTPDYKVTFSDWESVPEVIES